MNTTPQEMIEVLQAFIDGKVIQSKLCKELSKSVDWADTSNPVWRWDVYNYRIKPEPKLVPLTINDIPPICWIRVKGDCNRFEHLVTSCCITYISFNGGKTTWRELFERSFEYSSDRKTWLPCHKNEGT